ncbi:MAG: hypothetical protein ACYCPT_02330 [Acidimicrobiales bacterium]
MSEYIALGPADGSARWFALRRHQAVLVVVGGALLVEWLLSPHSTPVELILAGAMLLGVAPTHDGLTLADQCVIGLLFIVRAHWRSVAALDVDGAVVLRGSVAVEVKGYELRHWGRLDLSGEDLRIAESLVSLANAAGASSTGQHFSVHVHHRQDVVSTLLALPIDMAPPEGWRKNNELLREVSGIAASLTSTTMLERLTYLRATSHLVRVYRVRDFSGVTHSRVLLEQLLHSSTKCDLALHVDVVSGSKSARLSSRAVHRVNSDDAASRSFGFRRSASSSRSFERLSQRETLVARGESLVRLGVFVLVRAESLDELHERSATLWRHAHDAGLRLERGWGRQALWCDAQLPGGPGW